jgi:hypothetical protein
MFRSWLILSGACLAVMATGCGPGGGAKEETIAVKQPIDPMNQVKATLDNYVKGQPLGSEVTSYPYLVNEVRKSDPAKADILEKGFADLQKSKDKPAAKAKELLKQLGLEETK